MRDSYVCICSCNSIIIFVYSCHDNSPHPQRKRYYSLPLVGRLVMIKNYAQTPYRMWIWSADFFLCFITFKLMIDLTSYTFIKDRRNWMQIYKSQDSSHILKLWAREPLYHEKCVYDQLRSFDIQLPTIIEYYDDSIQSRIKESFLWEYHFGDLFIQSMQQHWCITDELWNHFIWQTLSHHIAQGSIFPWTIRSSPTANTLRKTLREENRLPQDLIDAFEIKLNQDLYNHPLRWMHGDYGPFNVFPAWVIDIEDSTDSYWWYDAVSVFHLYWYPIKHNILTRTRSYNFTPAQIQSYLAAFSQTHIPLNNPWVFGPLFLYKSIWSCIHDSLERQNHKYPRFERLINAYLDGKNMIEYMIKTFDE